MDKNSKDKGDNIQFVDIPEIFYESGTNGPFQECTMCSVNLIDNDIPYMIEKAIKNYPEENKKDVIFEYALCINCVHKSRERLSRESLQRIESYIINNSNLVKRRQSFESNNNFNTNDWLSHCVVKNKKIEDLPEYQIICQCQGKKMLYNLMPYMLSCDATDEMQQLLSAKTREELDRFYSDNLDIPPELKELFKTKKPVF